MSRLEVESQITYHNMRYPIIFGIAATIALVQTHPARAESSTEVAQVAKAITVMITTQGSVGSGVIIKHEGDTYTILTAAHVVKSKSETYTLTTADGKQHQLNNATIKKLPKSIDLAVVKFTSTSTYPIAKIGSSSQALEGTTVYAAGFPAPTRAIQLNPSYTKAYLSRGSLKQFILKVRDPQGALADYNRAY